LLLNSLFDDFESLAQLLGYESDRTGREHPRRTAIHCIGGLTFQQTKELGGFVKKREHGSTVVYASTFKKSEADDQGDEIEREIPFLKQYTEFNAEQCEGLPDHYYATATKPNSDIERIEGADRFFKNLKADIREGGDKAYYTITHDYIGLPFLETFINAESHAATLAHEFCHWTRHPKRLDRDLGRKRFGDASYAMEELVAELGSAFLCAGLSITPEVRPDHAEYLATWLQVLKEDKRAIFTAASHASKDVEYLHSLQPQDVAKTNDEEGAKVPPCL
jgi:antirestriction protein ArdC